MYLLSEFLPHLVKLIKNPKPGDIEIDLEEMYYEDHELNALYEAKEFKMDGVTYKTKSEAIAALLQTKSMTSKEIQNKIGKGANSGVVARVAQKIGIKPVPAKRASISVKAGKQEKVYTKQSEHIEVNLPRIAYASQIKNLKSLVSAVAIKGVSNALFVAGRGGTGKTFNVEQTLQKAGLQDGEGYFLNTTSDSAAGMYKTMYQNRRPKDIILFDDADSIFKDQEGRNILKTATDTKPKRKMV